MAATDVVAMVKVAVLLPAFMKTELPGTAAALLLESETANPPVGASPFKITVPVETLPPMTAVGLSVTPVRARGTPIVTVNGAVNVTPLEIARRLPVVTAATAWVVTLKVAVDAPALTVTEAGSKAAALLLSSDTVTPPAGAGPVSETVAVEDVPAATLAGLSDRPERATAGVTISGNVWVTLL